MKCCKEDVTTPFCPHCGKPNKSSPLLGLMVHLQNHRNGYAQSVQRTEGHVKSYPGDERHEKQLVAKKTILSKWDQWIEALQNVINERQEIEA